MTDQTQFERDLADRMRARADRTRIGLDHDRITGARRARSAVGARPSWAVAGAFAAVIALVVTGLVLLVRSGDDEPAPADTFPPVLPAPATTVPPPDYGVLDDAEGPTIDDHWHMAYGFFLCGQWFQLTGNLEDPSSPGYESYIETGIHSHDDGVIHVHPFADAGAGDNARLGVFLLNYGTVLGDRFVGGTEDRGQPMWEQMPCDITLRPISVVVWPDATNPVDPIVITRGLFDVPLRDGAAITITDSLEGVAPPPWAGALPDLAALDSAQVTPGELLATVATSGPPVVDRVACGQSVGVPGPGLGIEVESVTVDERGAVVTVRNTTSSTIDVGVAPFLVMLDDGAIASRSGSSAGWLSVDVAAGESLAVPIGSGAIDGPVAAMLACPGAGTPDGQVLAAGSYGFVALLDIAGAIVASDPVMMAVTDGGAVVASSVPTTP